MEIPLSFIDKYIQIPRKLIIVLFISIMVVLLISLILICIDRNQYELLILVFGPIIFVYFLKLGLKSLLILYVLVFYFNYFVYVFKLPRVLTWYIEICSFSMLMLMIIYILKTKNISKIQHFYYIIIIIISIHLISFIINKQSITRLFMSMRIYYVYVVFFFAIIYLPTNKKIFEVLCRIIFFTMFIQIPVSILQDFIFIRADFKGGLFGLNSAGTMATLGVAFLFCGYYLYRYYKHKIIFLFCGLGMLIPLTLSEAKIGVLLLIPASFYNIFLERKKIINKFLFLLLLLPLYIVFLQGFDYINSRHLEYVPYMHRTLKNPFYMLEVESAQFLSPLELSIGPSGYVRPTMGRFKSIEWVFEYISHSPSSLLFGFGPGEASQDPLFPGSLVNLGFFASFITLALLEWGFIGTAIWLVLFVYIFYINMKCLNLLRSYKSRSYLLALCFYSNMQMFVFLFDFVYSKSFLLEYKALYFWLTNGIIIRYYFDVIKTHKSTISMN